MPVAEEADASTVREEFFLQSGCQLYGRALWQAEVANKITQLLLGKWMWSIIFKNHFFFVFMSFNTGGIFVTNVRKFSDDRYWNFIPMSYRTTCWLKIMIFEVVPVLSVDPSHINSAEVAISDMVCRLPPNHWNFKVQTPLAIGPPTQSLGACLAHHVWRPSFILVSRFNTKISMVSTRYETCAGLPIGSNGVFSSYVAERVGLISPRSSGWSHLIHLQISHKLVPPQPTASRIWRHQHDNANIPKHTWSENTRTCTSGVSYTLPGVTAPLTLVLIHQLYALPHQFLETFEVLWLQTDPFST